jgi:hypothetical protein
VVISKAGGMAGVYFGQQHWWATTAIVKDIGHIPVPDILQNF